MFGQQGRNDISPEQVAHTELVRPPSVGQEIGRSAGRVGGEKEGRGTGVRWEEEERKREKAASELMERGTGIVDDRA